MNFIKKLFRILKKEILPAEPGQEQEKEQDQGEIIIKCSLEEMAKAFFRDYEIIWHNLNVNSEENQQYIAQLEKLCTVKTFAEWKDAEDYIKTAQTICHVIQSEANRELLVKEIFSCENNPRRFAFHREEEAQSNRYERVLCKEAKIEDAISLIQNNLLELNKQSSLRLDLPAFAPIFNDWDTSQINYLHLYLKVIPNFNNRAQAKKDFVDLSKKIYSGKENIADFEQTYNDYDKEAILKWYTRESFLYKMINNCLRIAISDSIQYCRLLLKDVENAIRDQYQAKSKNLSGLLYRGAYLSDEEWSSLKTNVNKEIEMHGFLSVSKEKKIALNFVKIDPSKKVFITVIVPKGPVEEEQGFAEVEEFSDFPIEKEVLFNVRSRFTVLETEEEYSQDEPYRHLVLLYGAQGLRKYITEKNPVQEISIENIDDQFCSHCKAPFGQVPEKMFFMSLADPEKRIYSCQKCLADEDVTPFLCVPATENTSSTREIKGCFLMNSSQSKIPLYGYRCSKCGVKNQQRYLICADCGGEKWCQSCFENELDCIEAGHSVILENYPFRFWCEKMSEAELNHLSFQNDIVPGKDQQFQQAQMYFETHEYEKAIEYYRRYIQENESKGNNDKLASSYKCIGEVYTKQGEHKKAMEYSLKSLEISKSIHKENSSEVAASLSNMGETYFQQGEYKKALEYHLKSLDIQKLIYGENNVFLATSLYNIGLIYQKQGEFQKALEFSLKSVDLFESNPGENLVARATSTHNIGVIYMHQGEFQKAIEYSLKSIDIFKSARGESHPHLGIYYSTIGTFYYRQGNFKKALEYHLKSLEIGKTVYGENHPRVASTYHQIGLVYSYQRDFPEALEYYTKSLGIYKSLYGENHSKVAGMYNNIAMVYNKQGEPEKALEPILKSLDVMKAVYGENHFAIATSYSSLGVVYSSLREFEKALEYSLKSLEILESYDGKNQLEIVICYNRIGKVYYELEEFEKALEYAFKALEIGKRVHGENHPEVGVSYRGIACCYERQGEKTEKIVEYYQKSLDIFLSAHGEDDELVVETREKINWLIEVENESVIESE